MLARLTAELYQFVESHTRAQRKTRRNTALFVDHECDHIGAPWARIIGQCVAIKQWVRCGRIVLNRKSKRDSRTSKPRIIETPLELNYI
jgi:hypothetical protein